MTFNLVDEPWILVQTLAGQEEVSVRDLFERSEEIRSIAGEVPTQGFAILRLLLAICHDAIGWHTVTAMNRLHEEGLDIEAVGAYLDVNHHLFDLFDPVRPFMQVADLRTAKGEHSGLEKLIADVPNGEQFFTTRAGRGLDEITAAEAARWLVHAQAFDPSGIRSGAVGDPLVKGGRGYPIGQSWAGQLGGVVLHGGTLRETLRLNLTPTPKNAGDIPVWRLERPQSEQRAEECTPAGPVQTLVWQSRRVRLVGNRLGVHGVVLCQGDKVLPQQMRVFEPMTGWRYSKPQSKKLGRIVYMPHEHDAGRAMWRGLPAIVTAGVEKVDDAGSSHDRFQAPATVAEANQRGKSFVLQTVGIQYGPQNATIEEIIDDRMELSTVLLSPEAVATRIAVKDGVDNADACVRALGRLAANVARAAGERGDSAGDGARQRAMAEAWASLDVPARRWIGSLDTLETPLAVKREWQETVDEVVRRLGERLVDSAGPAAVRGRGTDFGFMSAHLAFTYFLRDLRKELPLIHSTSNKEHHE